MYYKCHKVNFRGGGSYVDSPDRIKNKKEKSNNKSKKWWWQMFSIWSNVALNYGEIESHPEKFQILNC